MPKLVLDLQFTYPLEKKLPIDMRKGPIIIH